LLSLWLFFQLVFCSITERRLSSDRRLLSRSRSWTRHRLSVVLKSHMIDCVRILPDKSSQNHSYPIPPKQNVTKQNSCTSHRGAQYIDRLWYWPDPALRHTQKQALPPASPYLVSSMLTCTAYENEEGFWTQATSQLKSRFKHKRLLPARHAITLSCLIAAVLATIYFTAAVSILATRTGALGSRPGA
jgi:hypothetical protein